MCVCVRVCVRVCVCVCVCVCVSRIPQLHVVYTLKSNVTGAALVIALLLNTSLHDTDDPWVDMYIVTSR
jgi:hypothetical protein